MEQGTVKFDRKKALMLIQGSLREHSNFPTKLDLDGKELTIKFENARYMNSTGMKLWLRFVGDTLNTSDLEAVYIEQLPIKLVDMANSITGFLPKKAVINSFLIPMYCEELDQEVDYLLVRGEHYNYPVKDPTKDIRYQPLEMPGHPGKFAHFDGRPELYFKFLL